ncbi:MBOAT family protein [bacterium]|nr:MBOAT family protein [bacterium]
MLHYPEIFIYDETNPLLFSQYAFLFLFTAMFIGYTFVYKNFKLRSIYLLVFSLFFYYKCGGIYFSLLIFSTLVDYGCGFGIFHAKSRWRKKFFLVLSMISNLGLLAFFKYSYYVVDLINQSFGTDFRAVNFLKVWSNELFSTNLDIFEIMLPVGISFYTFQTMSYSIDIYRNRLEPCKNIFDFAFFVSFFPQLVAGPIVRAADFIPQIRKPFFISKRTFAAAIFLIMAGLIKKVFISDYISINFVDRVFADPILYSGFMNLMAIYGYSIQIYCDFSGYSDMAIGLAALLGFRLPINFNSPYKADSITDFWRRWHISLSTWLRDYLYISLGGNRKGKIRTYFNLMMTMLLGGLWHGAATKFIIWGGLHGVALAFHKVWMSKVKVSWGKFGKILSIILTFHFVAFCWLYFRAADMETVRVMLHNIGTNFDWAGIGSRIEGYKLVFAVILIGYLLHYFPTRWKSVLRFWFTKAPLAVKVGVFAAVIFLTFQATSADIQPFIYFQF